MALSIGIVGLPNVGKSTLFKALTNVAVDIQNYPFTTIDPNIGVVAVPDERLNLLAQKFNSKKVVPAAIEFIDIAGLVKGAAQGEGLGNQFLAHIREVDAIAHIVRVFEDSRITHVHKKIDPQNDMGVIETELALADLQTKEKRGEKTLRQAQGQGKDLPPLNLLTDKKIIYVFNVSEEQISNKWEPSPELLEKIGRNKYVVLSSKFDLLISESAKDDASIYLAELGLKESGINVLIKECYGILDLITFFTTGEDETRAWTVKINTPAPQAARSIHTDFERFFIKAEVINWKDLLAIGSWSGARETGILKTAGREYIVQEGDVMEVKI